MSKARIVKLLKILEEKTCYGHTLNSEELIAMLAQQGETVERKAIYSDISALNEMGYNIEYIREGNQNGYYFDSPLFEDAELRVLADAVLSSNFITDRKTDEMLGKIYQLTNEYTAEMMKDTLAYRHPKRANEQILYNITFLQEALFKHQQISFDYFDYDIHNEKKYRKKERYVTIPYCLLWYQERYYLIGYSEKYDDFTHYRVDRMEKIECEDTEHVFKNFDPKEYVQRIFQMYSGEGKMVKLRCPHRLASEVIDKFGDSVIVTFSNDEYFEASVRVALSNTFYAWIFTFGGDIEIVSPENVREEYCQLCEAQMAQYRR